MTSESAVDHYVERVIGDFGSASNFVMAAIGDELGLYRTMAGFGGPITSHELANKTGTSERYKGMACSAS
jgi:hypothetical protein